MYAKESSRRQYVIATFYFAVLVEYNGGEVCPQFLQ